jgi:hypothetical protein
VSDGTRTRDRLDHNRLEGGQVGSDLALLCGFGSDCNWAVFFKLMPQLMPRDVGLRMQAQAVCCGDCLLRRPLSDHRPELAFGELGLDYVLLELRSVSRPGLELDGAGALAKNARGELPLQKRCEAAFMG